MTRVTYRITREIAIILSLLLSIKLVIDGEIIRCVQNIFLLGIFLFTSVQYEKRNKTFSTSYLFIFVILYIVYSVVPIFFTDKEINNFNSNGKFGYWIGNYFWIYFTSVILSYLVINIYLIKKKTQKKDYVTKIDVSKNENNCLNITCILLLIIYWIVGKPQEIAIPLIVCSISLACISKQNKVFNWIICIAVMGSTVPILLSRYRFVQILLPLFMMTLILSKKNKKNISLAKGNAVVILLVISILIYGIISEIYKLNHNWNGNYTIGAIFSSFDSIKYFVTKQLYRIFVIWIKLGNYIIYHAEQYGYFYGLTYVKVLANVFGFNYVSLPKISAYYDNASYAQPGLLAEGYANFGIIGATLNIVLVFFLMELFTNSFNKKPTYFKLLLATVPFSKIILDGGSLNSAVVLIAVCIALNIFSVFNMIVNFKNKNDNVDVIDDSVESIDTRKNIMNYAQKIKKVIKKFRV